MIRVQANLWFQRVPTVFLKVRQKPESRPIDLSAVGSRQDLLAIAPAGTVFLYKKSSFKKLARRQHHVTFSSVALAPKWRGHERLQHSKTRQNLERFWVKQNCQKKDTCLFVSVVLFVREFYARRRAIYLIWMMQGNEIKYFQPIIARCYLRTGGTSIYLRSVCTTPSEFEWRNSEYK